MLYFLLFVILINKFINQPRKIFKGNMMFYKIIFYIMIWIIISLPISVICGKFIAYGEKKEDDIEDKLSIENLLTKYGFHNCDRN